MLFIALLRGINVGGNNIIKMKDLQAFFESLGFDRVSTYIQSGNVLFTSSQTNIEKLTKNIEQALSKKFNYAASVVVISHDMLKKVVKQAPKGFGGKPDEYRYDVIFLKPPLRSSEAIKVVPVKEGVDHVSAGAHALYFSRLIKKATQSRISKIGALPVYKQVTIRNWNTTTKLLALLDAIKQDRKRSSK